MVTGELNIKGALAAAVADTAVATFGPDRNPDFADGYAKGAMVGGGLVAAQGLAEILGGGAAIFASDGALSEPAIMAMADGAGKLSLGVHVLGTAAVPSVGALTKEGVMVITGGRAVVESGISLSTGSDSSDRTGPSDTTKKTWEKAIDLKQENKNSWTQVEKEESTGATLWSYETSTGRTIEIMGVVVETREGIVVEQMHAMDAESTGATASEMKNKTPISEILASQRDLARSLAKRVRSK